MPAGLPRPVKNKSFLLDMPGTFGISNGARLGFSCFPWYVFHGIFDAVKGFFGEIFERNYNF